MKNIKLFLALLISLAITACGGGGGSGPTSLKTPLNIDLTNMRAITATAIKTASGTTFEFFNPDTFATVIYAAKITGGDYSTQCDNFTGTLAVTINSTPNTIVYTDCTLAGKKFNGSVLLNNPTLDNINDVLISTITFNNLTVTMGLNTVTLSGGYKLTANGLKTTFPRSFRANGVGAELTITSGTGQTEVISSFDFITNILTLFTTTYTSDFTLASSSLGGSFRHLSKVAFPFEKNSAIASPYPFTGDADIFGANPTQLRVSVKGNSIALPDLIQVDLSTDGIQFFTTPYKWAELYP